jgi:hypothetical protein
MVKPSAQLRRLRHDRDIVRKVGDAQKARQNRSVVVANHPLTFAKSEDIDQEIANLTGVGCQKVDVVNTANRHPDSRASLRTIAQGRLLPRWRGDVVDVPKQLHAVALRCVKPIGTAMPNVAIKPTSSEPGCLDGGDPPFQRLRASGTPRDMSQPGAWRHGHLKAFLDVNNSKSPPSYEEAAATLQVSVGAVKTLIHRLRKQYAVLVREEVERTVSDPGDVDAEIHELCEALVVAEGWIVP